MALNSGRFKSNWDSKTPTGMTPNNLTDLNTPMMMNNTPNMMHYNNQLAAR
jgi:hypothetical protein